MKVLRTISVITLSVLMCSCTSVDYVRFDCPPAPTLPEVKAVELESLSDDAYRNLVERELRLRKYINKLEVYCYE